MRHSTPGHELRILRKNQEKLVAALQVLFDLLEEYAPHWYMKKHRDLASAALACTNKRRWPAK
jgi:hypothetical protein